MGYVTLLTLCQDPEEFERKYAAIIQPEPAAPRAPRQPRRGAAQGSDDDGNVVGSQFTTVGRGGRTMQFTSDTILKTLQSVQEARGKKVCLQDDSFLYLRLRPVSEHRQS